jgi:hypothetical protein
MNASPRDRVFSRLSSGHLARVEIDPATGTHLSCQRAWAGIKGVLQVTPNP